MTRTVDWYFDFISPFSYLQTARFGDLPSNVTIAYKPVLFAGLLEHYRTLGPAEVAPKRTFTYRYCHWLARRLGVPFRMPPAHPFNPLKALRLCIARGARSEDVFAIFRAIWVDGHLPDTADDWRAIGRAVGVDDPDTMIRADGVKQTLRDNTAGAIAAGVFGVPTFVFAGVPFWGVDATDFLIDVLDDPSLLDDAEMKRIASLPASVQRSVA
jgi:2-hydroxychromene-2-carboxylate isomerase